jgi:feruloyl esterase
LSEAPTVITAAAETDVNGHQMCVDQGTISPRIQFMVQLPVEGWTQRYLQTGCGGLCGRLGIESPQRDCAPEQNGEMATTSTDMGHVGQDGSWGASDMQLRVDFGYRGVHVTSLIAKQLIKAYYGQKPAYSYFSGCSDGGREALMEAQRYPDDFDGIAAGAPALNFLVQNTFHHGWNVRIVDPESDSPALAEADLPVLHAGALAACDAADGVEDGLIGQPVACTFDPATLICAKGETKSCLSPRAAAAAAEIYRGAHDGATKLVVGPLLRGSELEWAGVFVPTSAPPGGMQQPDTSKPVDASTAKPAMDQPALGGGKRFVLSPSVVKGVAQSLAFTTPYNPDWTLDDLSFSARTLEDMRAMHAIFDATDPDIAPFHAAGGKLIIWHGLADPHISPLNTIGYVQAVRDTIGPEATDAMLRLFLIPGMAHCGGGSGLTSIDVMTPLMDWVESGVAPNSLMASESDEAADAGKGRRLLPFPATTVLSDGGKPSDPASWVEGQAFQVGSAIYSDWAGADYFRPGFQQTCGFEGTQFICRR